MRRPAGISLIVVLLVLLAALPALAWNGEGYGDCDGWHVTNPEADWNSPEWEMVIFPIGMIVAYGETVTVPPQFPEEAERSLWLAWRKVDDGDNYKHQDKLELTRDLTECTPASTTTTTEAPPSTTTTTEPSPSTTLTTAPSTTSAPPTSSSTTTTAPTTSTTSPAPTLTVGTTPPTDPPTADTLPRTGIGSAPLVGVAGLSGLIGLLLIGRKGDD